jgi:hypothetical protein
MNFTLPGNAIAHRREHFRDAHEDRGVRVVAAACITPHCCPLHSVFTLLGERDVHFFGDRQRIHVGAQRHHGPGLAALEQPDDAGVGDLVLHLDAERAQVVGDDLRGAELAVAELRVLVEVAAPGDDLRLRAGDGVGDGGVEREGGVGGVHW